MPKKCQLSRFFFSFIDSSVVVYKIINSYKTLWNMVNISVWMWNDKISTSLLGEEIYVHWNLWTNDAKTSVLLFIASVQKSWCASPSGDASVDVGARLNGSRHGRCAALCRFMQCQWQRQKLPGIYYSFLLVVIALAYTRLLTTICRQ